MIYQLLQANVDVNGNPRRLIICYDETKNFKISKIIDEGYNGRPKGTYLLTIDITPKEYYHIRDEIII